MSKLITLGRPQALKQYTWQAIDHSGAMVHGHSQAHTHRQLKQQLQQQQLLPIKINYQRKRQRAQKISPKACLQLLQRIGNLLASGLNLDNILELLLETQNNPLFIELITKFKSSITAGQSLSHTLSQHPKYFSATTCTLIAAGEQSGQLAQILHDYCQQQLAMLAWRQKLRQAMRYPLIILSTAIIIIYSLLTFALPQLQSLFADFNHKLPQLTQVVITISVFCQTHSLGLFLTVAMIITLLKQGHRQRHLAIFFAKCSLKSRIYQQAQLLNWCFTLEIALRTGSKLTQALELAANAVSNPLLKRTLAAFKIQIEAGSSLHTTLRQSPLFNTEFLALIKMAEQNNQLCTTLQQLFKQMQTDLMNQLDAISKLLEPCIMLVLAVIIGTIVIAMYLPIFTMGSML